ATTRRLLEVDPNGKEVFAYETAERVSILSAVKLRNGQMVLIIAGGACVRLDAAGKELHRFQIGSVTLGGLDVLPDGHLLLAKNSNRVVEFDAAGSNIWQVAIPGPTGAVRLPNGHTLVGSAANQRVVEFNSAGQIVWETRDHPNPWRARRY